LVKTHSNYPLNNPSNRTGEEQMDSGFRLATKIASRVSMPIPF
jgi:hypothetical protein